jgi:hypothetical protein
MKRTLIILAALAAVSACGGSTSSTTTTPAAGSPSAAAGSPSADLGAAPSPLPSDEAGAICAGIGAEIIAGDGAASGVVAEENLYHVSQAQVIAAVAASCPDLSKDMP